MKKPFSKYLSKLFFKKWIIGVCNDNIENIIRKKTFEPQIEWLKFKGFESFYADPFILSVKEDEIKLLYEIYPYCENYGKIALLTLDNKFKIRENKQILDTKSHLSYPFVYRENNKTYIFPESAQNKKLSCFEFDQEKEEMSFIKDLIDLPLRDSTILKYQEKYWIFGTQSDNGADYKLHIYVSENLLGKYRSLTINPIKNGLDGTRAAGNFFEVDGVIYRPAQNCKNSYGESINIYKVNELSETAFREEPYMTIKIDSDQSFNKGIHSVHTLNILGSIIVIDGEQWIFAPWQQLKSFVKNRGRISF